MSGGVLAAMGLAVLGAVWVGPLPALVAGSFAAHMTMHMGVVAVAAPLIALGVAGQPFDPVRRWPALFPPLVASFVELAVVWIWHVPALHHLARHHPYGLLVEQLVFLGSGLWLWLAVFGGAPEHRGTRGAAGLVAMLLTSMHMTLLGALLALSPRALYSRGHAGDGMSPIADQHLGGAIMLLVGGVAYLAGGLWLGVELLRGRSRASMSVREAG